MRSVVVCLILCFAATGLGQISIDSVQQKPLVPNNRWALVVGVSGYKEEIGALKYTAKEAGEFAELLTGELQFDPANVKLLNDGGAADSLPTSANILASLDALLADKKLDKANLFVFYFSGHGVATPKGDFLLPLDATKAHIEDVGIPVREVVSKVVKAGLKNVLFIADACRAGTQNDFGEEFTMLCHQANLAVILGCEPGKRSYEYADLKQGAFTHFLLEGLRRKELRDGSGTLWASNLGKDLQKRVHDFTEPDHGKFAQTPYLWGEQSTLDVLLATYPQPPVSDLAIRSFKETAAKLDRRAYASAMVAYSSKLIVNDRYDQAIELLKTVDQLGETSPATKYLLATSLHELGRSGEAERVFGAMMASPEGYYRDLACLSSSSKSLDPKLRIDAAFRVFESASSWNAKMLASAVVELWGSHDERLKMARLFASSTGLSERMRQYAAGKLADTEGRWADAIAAFQRALKSPGDAPSDFTLFFSKVHPLTGSGDKKALLAIVSEAIQNPQLAGFGYLLKAQADKDAGNPAARVADLKQALSRKLQPDEIWLAVRIAGPYIGQLLPEFRSTAEGYPFAWKARIVLAFVKQIQGDAKGVEADALAADRYMDEPLSFKSTFFDLMYSFLSEARELGRVSDEAFRAQLDFYFLTLLEDVSKFGYDADLWMQLTTYGLFNERTAQVTQMASKYLPFAPEQAPKALKPMLLLTAMNRGDAATVQSVFKGGFEPAERRDPTWLFAMFQATLGQSTDAAKLIENLGPPSDNLIPRSEAFKTYLLAKAGKPASVGPASEDIVIRCLQGLTWAALGKWDTAEPLLLEPVSKRDWTHLFLQEFAMRTLDARYRSTGRLAAARDIVMSIVISQPGNPLFDRYTFAATPGIAQFSGSVALDGFAVADRIENVKGRLQFTVQSSGSLTGSFDEAGGVKHPFRGEVDTRGNVKGTGDWAGQTFMLSGKIAPPALYRTYPGFKDKGQVLQLVDNQGYRIALIGRTKS